MTFQGGRYRVRAGDNLRLVIAASAVTQVEGWALGLYDNGEDFQMPLPAFTTGTTRVNETSDSSIFPRDGWITDVILRPLTAPTKRGTCYANLQIRRHNIGIYNLGQDYIFSNNGIVLGEFHGPLEGRGNLDWIQEANDAAGNVVTPVSLARTNSRRMIRAIMVKYHQVGGADATITITLRDLADSGGPTNWSIESDTWVSPSLVLGANQEGLIHVGEHGFVSTNDAGVITYADNTTAPNPFPFMVEEGETADLIIAASGGASGDDYDVWVQYEEWIEL